VDYIECHTLREEGLDPDNPAVITVINAVCWELALLSDGHVIGVAERDVREATHGGDMAGLCRRF
jgi:hypothetical protein